jgi:hypothetical protein
MPLSVKRPVYSLPSYSLTGDLIGFLRCGLQYRYQRLGNLPSSRPVQLWFGEFIHGVMEEAFVRYREQVQAGKPPAWPWAKAEIDNICDLVNTRLKARGLEAWAPNIRALGYQRAEAATQDLGPHLFPIVAEVEIRLTGSRPIPPIPAALQFRRADRYEMVGVIDVVTNVRLAAPAVAANPIVRAILSALPAGLPPEFEVIVDYKGMRRPPSNSPRSNLWQQYAWQVQTYATLRAAQPGSKPVVAGALLYVNEIRPTRTDSYLLRREVRAAQTDVAPAPGSQDEQELRRRWPKGQAPHLSLGFRLARALRIVPVDAPSIAAAEAAFDGVVKDIESCRGTEAHGASILSSWKCNPAEQATCVVCDQRTYCPGYRSQYAPQFGGEPKLPTR